MSIQPFSINQKKAIQAWIRIVYALKVAQRPLSLKCQHINPCALGVVKNHQAIVLKLDPFQYPLKVYWAEVGHGEKPMATYKGVHYHLQEVIGALSIDDEDSLKSCQPLSRSAWQCLYLLQELNRHITLLPSSQRLLLVKRGRGVLTLTFISSSGSHSYQIECYPDKLPLKIYWSYNNRAAQNHSFIATQKFLRILIAKVRCLSQPSD